MMKTAAVVAVGYGLFLLGLSLIGAFLFQDAHSFFQESLSIALAEQGTSIEQYLFHWHLTLLMLGIVGAIAVILGVAIWKRSEKALRSWIGLVVVIILVQLFLLVFRPLPFGFEQVEIIDIAIHSAVLVVSIALFVRVRIQEGSDA